MAHVRQDVHAAKLEVITRCEYTKLSFIVWIGYAMVDMVTTIATYWFFTAIKKKHKSQQFAIFNLSNIATGNILSLKRIC